jgi:hypothetical protein
VFAERVDGQVTSSLGAQLVQGWTEDPSGQGPRVSSSGDGTGHGVSALRASSL